MQIQLLTTRADRARRYEIGDVIDVPDGEAIALIKSQQAVPVRAKPRETTIAPRFAEHAARKPPSRSTERR